MCELTKDHRFEQDNDKNTNIASQNVNSKPVDDVVSIVPFLKRDVSNIAEYLA